MNHGSLRHPVIRVCGFCVVYFFHVILIIWKLNMGKHEMVIKNIRDRESKPLMLLM